MNLAAKREATCMPELAVHLRLNELHQPNVLVVVPSIAQGRLAEPSSSICRCDVPNAVTREAYADLVKAPSSTVQVIAEVGEACGIIGDVAAQLNRVLEFDLGVRRPGAPRTGR